MRCEDYPCCGHEAGCCPSYDEAGNQTDMVCVCGQSLPLASRTSICEGCLQEGEVLMASDRGYRDGGYDPDYND